MCFEFLIRNRLLPAGFFLNRQLMALTICKAVNVSLTQGNCGYAAYAYASYGLLTAAMAQYDLAYRFGQLAFSVDEKFQNRALRHLSYGTYC